ncbi:MAG: protein Mom [Patescibacteria group bacterium]|nr:protein Mom [Patescibacteria group bacterium]
MLKIAWCTFEAAKFAVMNWHYSKCMPAGKLIKIGVWENDKFIGCVLFGSGANNVLGKPYGLSQIECCELVRIALNKHQTPVSRIVSISIKMLLKLCPKLRLIISFADDEQNHIGAIYQAGNWIYLGRSKAAEEYLVNGKRMHGRSMRALYSTHVGKDFIKKIMGSSKYRYAMPLDDKMKSDLMKLSKPYPKRVKQATGETITKAEVQHLPTR